MGKQKLPKLEPKIITVQMDRPVTNLTPRMRLQNSIAVYTLGTMTKNYISGMKENYLNLDEVGRKRQRRLKDLELAINEANSHIEHQIRREGPSAENDILGYIGTYHTTCDEVFTLEEQELKRVNKLIEKIKRERQPRIIVTQHG